MTCDVLGNQWQTNKQEHLCQFPKVSKHIQIGVSNLSVARSCSKGEDDGDGGGGDEGDCDS